jgi:hypothetical protein
MHFLDLQIFCFVFLLLDFLVFRLVLNFWNCEVVNSRSYKVVRWSDSAASLKFSPSPTIPASVSQSSFRFDGRGTLREGINPAFLRWILCFTRLTTYFTAFYQFLIARSGWRNQLPLPLDDEYDSLTH